FRKKDERPTRNQMCRRKIIGRFRSICSHEVDSFLTTVAFLQLIVAKLALRIWTNISSVNSECSRNDRISSFLILRFSLHHCLHYSGAVLGQRTAVARPNRSSPIITHQPTSICRGLQPSRAGPGRA